MSANEERWRVFPRGTDFAPVPGVEKSIPKDRRCSREDREDVFPQKFSIARIDFPGENQAEIRKRRPAGGEIPAVVMEFGADDGATICAGGFVSDAVREGAL
jgi:hypothetical protein